MFDHGLAERQIRTLRTIFAPYAQAIESVALFGSRATGTYKPGSDIDIVIHGDIDPAAIDRLSSQLRDSDLPMEVDLLAYRAIDYPPLKNHIDLVSQVLFTHEDLSRG
jgi:predicted nucleotidyltransferase